MGHLLQKIPIFVLIISACILIPFFLATAQQLSNEASSSLHPPEPLYVSFDKPFYAVGETLWFSIFFLNPQTVQSRVMYVDMVNLAGEVVMQQKLKTDAIGARSEFRIPFSWSEGYYQFRAYTLWNLNFGKSYIFTKNIPIYSEWKETLAQPEYDENPKIKYSSITSKGALKIMIQPSQDIYQKREKVKVNIKITDANNQPVQAHFSVAVTDLNLISPMDSTDIASYQQETAHSSQNSLTAPPTYVPEKGLILTGILSDPDNRTPISTRFLSVYLAEKHSFLNTEIANGELLVKLPDFYGLQTIQIHNHNPYQSASPYVTITNTSALLPPGTMLKAAPPRTPAIDHYLYLSSMRRKLNEIFGVNDENAHAIFIDTATFTADKTYWMKDYHMLKNMEDFIREVIFKARIHEENESKTVRLYNPETQKYFEDAPWYLVNGYLVTDEALVLSIPANNIEKVAQFYRKNTLVQQFPPMMLRSSVLAIDTKENKIFPSLLNASNNFTYEGFYRPRSFESTLYKVSEKSAPVPDFRPLVFWAPQVSTDQNGSASLTFTGTDDISSFLIRVEGVSVDGNTGIAEAIYQVTF